MIALPLRRRAPAQEAAAVLPSPRVRVEVGDHDWQWWHAPARCSWCGERQSEAPAQCIRLILVADEVIP